MTMAPIETKKIRDIVESYFRDLFTHVETKSSQEEILDFMKNNTPHRQKPNVHNNPNSPHGRANQGTYENPKTGDQSLCSPCSIKSYLEPLQKD